MTNNIQKDTYTAHGTLLSVTGLPRWEGSSGENEYICTTESFYCCETITTLLIGYTLIQSKK